MATYLDPVELGGMITDTDLRKYTEAPYDTDWVIEVNDAETFLSSLLIKRNLTLPVDWASVTDSVRQLLVAYLHMRMSLHRIGNNPQQNETGLVYDLYKAKYDVYKEEFERLKAGLTDELITGIDDPNKLPSYVIPTARR